MAASKAIINFFSNEDNMTANEIISNRRKVGILREFPGQYLDKKFKDISEDNLKYTRLMWNNRMRRAIN